MNVTKIAQMIEDELVAMGVRSDNIVGFKRNVEVMLWGEVTRESPVPMILCCPVCTEQHIDKSKEGWDNPPHRTHQCEYCNHQWRPSDAYTTGVLETVTHGGTQPSDALVKVQRRNVPEKLMTGAQFEALLSMVETIADAKVLNHESVRHMAMAKPVSDSNELRATAAAKFHDAVTRARKELV